MSLWGGGDSKAFRSGLVEKRLTHRKVVGKARRVSVPLGGEKVRTRNFYRFCKDGRRKACFLDRGVTLLGGEKKEGERTPIDLEGQLEGEQKEM